jgi:hypothetical protein
LHAILQVTSFTSRLQWSETVKWRAIAALESVELLTRAKMVIGTAKSWLHKAVRQAGSRSVSSLTGKATANRISCIRC